jgi:DNA repair protein RecN (Recombination protein N)
LAVAERDRGKRQELLAFQEREIAAARLDAEEEEALASERAILVHHEKLFAAADGAYGILEESDGAVLDRLSVAAARLGDAAAIDERLRESLETLETGLVHLREAARGLRDYRNRMEFDPGRLDAIESRLYDIGRLKRKYGATVREILDHLARVRAELRDLEQAEGRLSGLDQAIAELAEDLGRRAKAISAARQEAARGLGEAVTSELGELGMARAGFRVEVAPEESAGRPFGPYGADAVEFLIAPNPGEPLKPLHRIASGGELSRTMLAVRTVLAAADGTPTVIFDEIDAGIGGGMGEVVGKKLVQTSRQRQVLCVTHLPQIACFADQHLVVSKSVVGNRTETRVVQMHGEDRVQEVSRMLGGPGRSPIAVQHARELLEGAERLKRRMRFGAAK